MKNAEKRTVQRSWGVKNSIKVFGSLFLLLMLTVFMGTPVSAHCDSYDGPVIKDAVKALETNNVNLVLKWVSPEQGKEIIPLFNRTYQLKSGDKEVYAIIEKHFFETLVRLHRETEGAPYTGLKPAGTTKQIIQMTDEAIKAGSMDDFLVKFNSHINKVIREKYQKVSKLNKVKDNSTELGREFVEAYVDYTHTVEALDDIMEHGGGHEGHKE